ncbi:MAG: hypothetical protein Tsb0034_12200 [Ekhidna sp.]
MSCSDNEESATNLLDVIDLEAEAALESNFEDLDVIVDAGLETVSSNGRVEEDEILDCAVKTHDKDNKTLTIDFGDGCEGNDGRVRAGKVIITYSDHRLIPGASRTITLDGFSVDGVAVEGTRSIENISASLDDHPTFSVSLIGGKMTFEDETFATRETEHTRTWVRGKNPLNDEAWIEGTASGQRRDAVSYQVTVLERIVYKRGCKLNRVFIPVSGVKQITSGGNIVLVDYGDGECDNIVTITINGGEPFTKEIKLRGRF